MEQVAAAADTKQVARYEDVFQQTVGKGIEGLGKKVEGKGRTLLYALGAVIVVALLAFLILKWTGRSNAAGQAALAKAIETSQARITDTPPPVSDGQKTFKSEKERADAAIAEFQSVADKFGGSIAQKAKYFIAVTRISSDRAAGVAELEAMANGSSDEAKLAKFALAQLRAEDGKYDDAAVIYKELIAMPDAIVAKDTINFELAKVYEKQNLKKEAADLYYSIAKAASDAKDAEGKPVPMSKTASDAKEKLTELDPERAKEIVEPAPENPFGGSLGL